MHRFAAVVVATVLGFTGVLTQASSPSQDAGTGVAPAVAKRLPSLTPVADWAPVFADWETSCNPGADMRQLVEGVQRDRRDVPARYRSQVGQFVGASAQADGWAHLVLAGTYHGMPIQALQWRPSANAGTAEYRLLVDVPLEAALRVPHLGGRASRAVQVERSNGGQQINIVCLSGI